MKRWILMLVAAGVVGCGGKKNDYVDVDLDNKAHRRSYGIGMDMAAMLKQQEIDIDVDVFVQGFKDRYTDDATLMTQEDVFKMVSELQQERMAEQQVEESKAADENKAKGRAFLEENKQKPGVVSLDSGLQYRVITQGTGPKPRTTDTVTFHYRGTLIDGTVFDSSYDRGEPATISVEQLIPGWIEALPMMGVGSKWELFVPYDLAYGERPGGPGGPGSTLIFEVELLDIKK